MGNIVYRPQQQTTVSDMETVLLDKCPKCGSPKIVTPEKPCETQEQRVVNAFANVEGMDENNKRVLRAFNEGGTSAGIAALMKGPNGEQLSYAESRMLYG